MPLLVLLMFVVLDAAAVGTVLAEKYADNELHCRELTVRNYGVDKKGSRYVELWFKYTIYLPWVPTLVHTERFYSVEAYEQIRTYGNTKYKAYYKYKQCLFVVKEVYCDIQRLEDSCVV